MQSGFPTPKQLFITRYRDAMRRFTVALAEMLNLKNEFLWLNYQTTMTDADFTDANSDIKAADLLNAAGAVDTVAATLAASSADGYSKIYKVRRQG